MFSCRVPSDATFAESVTLRPITKLCLNIRPALLLLIVFPTSSIRIAIFINGFFAENETKKQ